MKTNAKLLGLAAAISAALSYVVCASAVALAPATTSRAFGYVMHMDLNSIARPLTWSSFLIGVVAFSGVVGFLVWLAASVFALLSASDLRSATTSRAADHVPAVGR